MHKANIRHTEIDFTYCLKFRKTYSPMKVFGIEVYENWAR